MARSSRLSRRRPQRRQSKRVLIVVEGARGKSEQAYFQLLNQELRGNATVLSLQVEPGAGEPLRVLKKCRNKTTEQEKRAENGEPAYDARFIVVDRDDHGTLERVLQECESEQIHGIVTNPKFELWLLWHKDEQRASIDGAQLDRRVRDLHLVEGRNGKELAKGFEIKNYKPAMERAQKAWPKLVDNRVGPNPSSAIAWMIEEIVKLASLDKK